MTLAQSVAWLLSFYTLVSMAYAGSRPLWGWRLALCGQPLWLVYSLLSSDGLGFLPLNVGLTLIYLRNIRKARNETLPARS